MINKNLKIYAIQPDILWKDINGNIRKLKQTLQSAKPAPGSLIVLPEMFCSGFCMDTKEICLPINSPIINELSELAKKWKSCLVAGVPVKERRSGKGKNMALGFSPDGKLIYKVAKLHSFSPAGEDKYYQSGNQIRLFNFNGWKISAFICYDLRFPEIFRAATYAGANLILVLANWPGERAPHWLPLLQARAIENLAYVAGVNRCGGSPSHKYDGGSVIIDPWGQILAQADDKERVIWAEISLDYVKQIRKTFPALSDRKKRIRVVR